MSRYPDRDSRAPPPRERSPASRYRPAESYNPNFSSRPADFNRPYHDARAPPRGPRGVNDPPGRPAPTAPRGRGAFPGRSDSRDARDARDAPFPGDRFYEGGDRWDPGRRRSPIRDRRDSRSDFPPRQLDTDRARQETRDGPPSAGSNPSDGGFRGSGPAFRGGYGRGRGTEFRERSRIDDRSRPRSRSRGRQERDRSVDSRDLDRRERQRDNNERSYVRDRDERRDERDTYPRRVEPPQRIDTRPPAEPRGPPAQLTPQNERPPVAHVTPPDRAAGDFKREVDPSRRSSAVSEHARDGRRDSERSDPNAGRSDSRVPRLVSPPPSVHSVPPFGFRAPAPFTGVTSLSWKNPDLQKPPPASGPAQPSKPAPTAPKALATAPPTAPKADRALEKTPSKESLTGMTEDGPKERRMSVGASPSPRLTSGAIQEVGQQPKFSPSIAAGFLNPPSAPRAMTSPQPPFGRAAGAGPFGAVTSPVAVTNIPTGPKASTSINASPRMLSNSIPTGPRAERGPPPSGPRNAPAPPKLFKAASQTFPRTSVVPSKRDIDGFERERSPSSEAKPGDAAAQNSSIAQTFSNGLINGRSDPLAVKQEATAAGAPQGDVDMADVPAAEQNVSPNVDDGPKHFYHLSDEEEDNVDMAEMAEELEAKYMREKSRLEAQRIDVSGSEFRPTLLFPELSRFIAMRAMINDLSYRPRATAEKKEQIIRSKEIQHREAAPTEIPTPQEDPDQIMSDAYESRESSLDRMSTPDPDLLPYLEKGPPTPLSDPDPFSIVKREIPENDIKSLLKEDIDSEAIEQARLEHDYRVLYMEWKKYASSLDRSKEEAEQAAKQSSPESVAAPTNPEMPAQPLPTPTEGGRRTLRFASEYEIQRVMEISLREEEEKKLKELALKEAQVSANADREADIPALLPPNEAKRRIFEDVSQARRPEDALRIFEFVPPVDDFTEEEDRIMRDVYKEYTKVWGKIAKIVRRTYKECINHYYASKWNRPYKSRIGGKRGRAGRGRGKPGGRQRSALVPAEDASEVDANGAPNVTESGRPKRAAAPTWPKESDQDTNASGTGTGKRAARGDGKDSETGTEKPGRRKAKEKVPKKTARNQPLAARPTASPQKADRDTQENIIQQQQQPMEVDDSWIVKPPPIVRQTEPMPPLMPQPHIFPDANLTVFREANDIGAIGVSTERPRSHSNTTQRQGASSYWSVTEEQDFKQCLEYYGTDFQAISNHMGTKTHTMIKNHYQKFVNDGKHGDLIQRANEATQRRSRGEDMGPPPMPSQAPKRHGRYDTSTVPMPRSLAPSSEVAEAEQSPPLPVAVPFGMSPQFSARSGLPPQVARPAAATATSTPGHRSHPSGPIMGFFREDIRAQAPVNPIRPLIAPPEERQVQRGPERIKTEFRPTADHERELILRRQEQEREREREYHEEAQRRQAELEARTAQIAAAERREQQRVYQPPAPMGHTPQSSIHAIPSAPEHVRQDSRQHPNIFGASMTAPAVHANRNVFVDLTAPQAAALPESLERRPQSPIRHPAQPPRLQQPQLPPAAPSPVPTPVSKEAPRRSNLMSLLNSEPEQEKPKRREPEPALAPQYRISTSVQSETPPLSASARESMHDRPFSRPTYPPASQLPTSSMSTPTNESGPRDSLPPMGHRDSWPGRQPQGFQQTNSPGLHAQHAPPPGPERPSLISRDYRTAAFGPLRANPSPPPAAPGFGQHSRTSSYNHAQHQTPPSSVQIPPSVPPPNLHGIPYGQKEPLGPGLSPHLGPQQHPPPVTRPEFGYNHQRIQEPREALFDRFREREPVDYAAAAARERELREHQEQVAAYHQRYGGHQTPPVNQPRFPPPQPLPERNAGTPLGHMGFRPPQDTHAQAAMQRHHDIHQELQRRDFERERSRQNRMQQAAAEAEEIQRMKRAQEQAYRRPDERYTGMPPR